MRIFGGESGILRKTAATNYGKMLKNKDATMPDTVGLYSPHQQVTAIPPENRPVSRIRPSASQEDCRIVSRFSGRKSR